MKNLIKISFFVLLIIPFRSRAVFVDPPPCYSNAYLDTAIDFLRFINPGTLIILSFIFAIPFALAVKKYYAKHKNHWYFKSFFLFYLLTTLFCSIYLSLLFNIFDLGLQVVRLIWSKLADYLGDTYVCSYVIHVRFSFEDFLFFLILSGGFWFLVSSYILVRKLKQRY